MQHVATFYLTLASFFLAPQFYAARAGAPLPFFAIVFPIRELPLRIVVIIIKNGTSETLKWHLWNFKFCHSAGDCTAKASSQKAGGWLRWDGWDGRWWRSGGAVALALARVFIIRQATSRFGHWTAAKYFFSLAPFINLFLFASFFFFFNIFFFVYFVFIFASFNWQRTASCYKYFLAQHFRGFHSSFGDFYVIYEGFLGGKDTIYDWRIHFLIFSWW